MTNEEKDTIEQFVRNCEVNVQQGRIILKFNHLNMEMKSKLEAIFADTEAKLKKLDYFLNSEENYEIKDGTKIFSWVAVGTATGGFLGTPLCGLDVGLFAAVGAIIGGKVALTIVNSAGVTLGSLLLKIIDNMKEIQKHFAEAFGFELDYVKKD